MKTDILVIGGGLSGLSLADALTQDGKEFVLIEAASELGGRIKAKTLGGAAFDLGPAWFWPGQHRVAGLLNRLNVASFDQYASGSLVYQDRNGQVQRDMGFSSMRGSLRITGGMPALTEGLAKGLDQSRILLETKAVKVDHSGPGITVTAQQKGGMITIEAENVVFAIPPRIAHEHITFEPELPKAAASALGGISTWMAAHAKIIAVYDRAYWREQGLSGDGVSHKGPMVEIHDASPAKGGPYALFGFVGFPADVRKDHKDEVLEMAKAQLVSMFGQDMANPLAIEMMDWATNPFVATAQDLGGGHGHPAYGMPAPVKSLAERGLIFASTEMGRRNGGFVEGALEASEAAHRILQDKSPVQRASTQKQSFLDSFI